MTYSEYEKRIDAVINTILDNELDFQNENGLYDKTFIVERFNLTERAWKTVKENI